MIKKDIENKIVVPELIRDILERLVFHARESEYIDVNSGVSARMSISAMENLISTAERRMLINGEKKTTVRISIIIFMYSINPIFFIHNTIS